jgi:uncharacterized membrane protein
MAGLNDFAGAVPKLNVTGGMQQSGSGPLSNGELMSEARQALRGKWLGVIFSMLLFYILFCCTSLFFGVLGGVAGKIQSSDPEGGISSLTLWMSGGIGLASLIVGAFFTYGWFNYFRVVAGEGEARLDAFFEGGRKIFATIVTFFLLFGLYAAFLLASFAMLNFFLRGNLLGLLIGLGFLHFLPIYLVMRYSMVFFILTDDEYGAFGAMGRSSEIMVGFKWKLFCLFFRFCLLSLLAAIPGLLVEFAVPYAISYDYIPAESTLLLRFASGVWSILFSLWWFPYLWTSFACFYEDVK